MKARVPPLSTTDEAMRPGTFLTRDHDTIRWWVTGRSGRPVLVRGLAGDTKGKVRIAFHASVPGRYVEDLPWDEWLRRFDEEDLVLLFQTTRPDGTQSHFHRLVKASVVPALATRGVWIDRRPDLGDPGDEFR